jgi:hypothetical protein
MDASKNSAPAGQTSSKFSNRVVKANRKTVAARYNIKVLRGLETALLQDPEANLLDLLSSSYPEQLKSFKEAGGNAQCTNYQTLTGLANPGLTYLGLCRYPAPQP